MKSIKPGRGPSMMGAISGAAVALFGVVWTVLAASMGAYMMIPFGLIFVALAIGGAVYNYRNATRSNRYSSFDITEDGEEEDPLKARYGRRSPEPRGGRNTADDGKQSGGARYCPSCGARIDANDSYCRFCGTRL